MIRSDVILPPTALFSPEAPPRRGFSDFRIILISSSQKAQGSGLTPNPQPSMGTGRLQSILRDRAPLSAAAATTTQATMPTPLYPAITSNKPLLRVGVMLDDWTVPAWVADVLASIQ